MASQSLLTAPARAVSAPLLAATRPVRRRLDPWRWSTMGSPMRVEVPRDLGSVSTIDVHLEVDPRSVGVSPAAVHAIWGTVRDQYRTGLHPGLSLVIRRRGKVLISRGIGHATGYAPDDEEPAVLMTARTPLNAYSGSKAITAILLHRLVELGQLDLDTPVADHIPEFAQKGKGGITIRHLMTHRAGISKMPMKVGDDADRLLDTEVVLARLCAAEADTNPGENQAYHAATSGYLLGEVAERATGRGLRELLDEHVVQVIGGEGMTYGHPEDSPHVPARSAWTGPPSVPLVSSLIDTLLGVPTVMVTPVLESRQGRRAVIPAGNMYISAEDACKVYEAMRCGGTFEGRQLLRPETVTEGIRPAGPIVIDGSMPAPVQFSAGFMRNLPGVGLFGVHAPHAYGHLGFTNILHWTDPDRDISVALCSTGKSVHPAAFAAFGQSIGAISLRIPRR